MKKLALLSILVIAAVGCSGSQDVGDANAHPAPGTVSRPAAPGAPGGGSTPAGANPAAPQSPQ